MKIQRYSVVLIILAYIIILFIAPTSYINKPKFLILRIIKSPLYLTNRILDNIYFISHSKGLIEENIALRKSVDKLTSQLIQYKDTEDENIRLKKIIGFKEEYPHKLVATRIIAKDSSNLSDTMLIDKGRSSGIKKGTVVIGEAGLIGGVLEVSPDMSRVIIITDPNSRVSAMVLRSRQTGMVYGIQDKMCKLCYLPPDSDIVIGDDVITSGFSKIYPKGLIIGRVIKVEREPWGFGLFALVKPAVDISKIEELLCIIE